MDELKTVGRQFKRVGIAKGLGIIFDVWAKIDYMIC